MELLFFFSGPRTLRPTRESPAATLKTKGGKGARFYMFPRSGRELESRLFFRPIFVALIEAIFRVYLRVIFMRLLLAIFWLPAEVIFRIVFEGFFWLPAKVIFWGDSRGVLLASGGGDFSGK